MVLVLKKRVHITLGVWKMEEEKDNEKKDLSFWKEQEVGTKVSYKNRRGDMVFGTFVGTLDASDKNPDGVVQLKATKKVSNGKEKRLNNMVIGRPLAEVSLVQESSLMTNGEKSTSKPSDLSGGMNHVNETAVETGVVEAGGTGVGVEGVGKLTFPTEVWLLLKNSLSSVDKELQDGAKKLALKLEEGVVSVTPEDFKFLKKSPIVHDLVKDNNLSVKMEYTKKLIKSLIIFAEKFPINSDIYSYFDLEIIPIYKEGLASIGNMISVAR